MRLERIWYWRVTSFVLLTKYYWVYHVKGGMQWTVYVSLRGQDRNVYRYLVGIVSEGGHLEDLRFDGRIILKCVLKQLVWRA